MSANSTYVQLALHHELPYITTMAADLGHLIHAQRHFDVYLVPPTHVPSHSYPVPRKAQSHTMCQLQQTTYTCGHQRKTLLQACAFAQHLVATPTKRAPSFCINGLAIQQTALSFNLCGRSDKDTEPCAEIPQLTTLYESQVEVRKEWDAYVQRARSVAVCMNARDEPDCNWWQIAKELKDAGELKRRYEVVRCETLPACLARVDALLVETSEQVWSAAMRVVSTLIHRTYSDTSSDSQTNSDLDSRPGGDTEDVLTCHAQTCHELRLHIRKELHTLEHYAVLACLDGIGWRLSDDGDEELMEAVKGRDVKPLNGGNESWNER